MSAGKIELAEIFKRVREAKCITLEDVSKVIEEYFEMMKWSVLKDEWKKMTDEEKGVFIARVYFDTCGKQPR